MVRLVTYKNVEYMMQTVSMDYLLDELSDLEATRTISLREADRIYTRVLSGRVSCGRARSAVGRAIEFRDEVWPRDEVRGWLAGLI